MPKAFIQLSDSTCVTIVYLASTACMLKHTRSGSREARTPNRENNYFKSFRLVLMRGHEILNS